MRHTADLTGGNIGTSLLRFTLPMIAGAMLQQCYNIADTVIVGRFVGGDALAAVGGAYPLMVFLSSVIIGLTTGSGVLFSIFHGARRPEALKRAVFTSAVLTAFVTVIVVSLSYFFLEPVVRLLQVPVGVVGLMTDYLTVVYGGLFFTYIYNFYASLLRSTGDSVTPLWFLGLSVVVNIGLDLILILHFGMGISGAAWATVVSQGMASVGLAVFFRICCRDMCLKRRDMCLSLKSVKEIFTYSSLACMQQSVMNLGILAVQALVNSYGAVVMAAFAAGVKVDSFAYMPAQEFGNAFSTFVAQNYGAGKSERVYSGTRIAFRWVVIFSAAVSAVVVVAAPWLIGLFVGHEQIEIIKAGSEYLRIEGAFYAGIGILFLWYGYFRAIRRPSVSVALTIVSLGLRVVLAYTISAMLSIGVNGIWWSVPIGWAIADLCGWWWFRVFQSGVTCDSDVEGR